MNHQPDYAAMWPELFQDLPASTRETVLNALSQTADEGTVPSRNQAQILVDFATDRISAREFGQRTMTHLADQQATYVPSHAAAPEPEPAPAVPATSDQPIRILDHEEAAYAFVRGEVTVEEYLRNARMLRSRPV